MINLLKEFIELCNENKIAPSEKEIDIFLKIASKHKHVVNPAKHRDLFIYYCFYFWEQRTDKINILVSQLEMIKYFRPHIVVKY